MIDIVEIMRFKVRAGVKAEEVVRAGREANKRFDRTAGLQGRVLAGPDASGTWTDMLLWRDDESATAHASAADTGPNEASAYFNLVEPGSLTSEKLPVRVELGARAAR